MPDGICGRGRNERTGLWEAPCVTLRGRRCWLYGAFRKQIKLIYQLSTTVMSPATPQLRPRPVEITTRGLNRWNLLPSQNQKQWEPVAGSLYQACQVLQRRKRKTAQPKSSKEYIRTRPQPKTQGINSVYINNDDMDNTNTAMCSCSTRTRSAGSSSCRTRTRSVP
jgi:hypothetical protein